MTTDKMNDAQKAVYEKTGALNGPAGAWIRSPVLYERLGWMIGFLRNDCSLQPRLLELTILMTVGEWKSVYPWERHAPQAKKGGLSDGVIAAIKAGASPDFENADEEAVYNYVTELWKNHSVSGETYKAALEHVGEEGLVELMATLGLYTTVAMTVNDFEIPDIC